MQVADLENLLLQAATFILYPDLCIACSLRSDYCAITHDSYDFVIVPSQ